MDCRSKCSSRDDCSKLPLHESRTINEIHSHARIEVPSFPGAGASFKPARVFETIPN